MCCKRDRPRRLEKNFRRLNSDRGTQYLSIGQVGDKNCSISRRLSRGLYKTELTFTSVKDLIAKIGQFIDGWNDPFRPTIGMASDLHFLQ